MVFRIPGFFRWIGRQFNFFLGIGIGVVIVFLGYGGIHYSSTDRFCFLCHAHPQSVISWKKSTHYKNKTGMVVHCVECHLPPGGMRYLTEKTRLGVRDVYSFFFKDVKKINWEAKSTLLYARKYTYDSSCIKCHPDLYSLGLTPKGVKSHEHYMRSKGRKTCIECHLDVGHFSEKTADSLEVHPEREKIKPPLIIASDSSVVFQRSENLPKNFVDATTQATTYNAHEGSEKSLLDGKYPSNDKNATYFKLKETGILSIVLSKPTAVKSLRIFFGEHNPGLGLTLMGYLGGKLDKVMAERHPEGEFIIMVEKIDALPQQWNTFDIEGKTVDNFDLANFGTATYYEIQVVASK